MKRKKLKKQRKIITISAIILLLTLSIGYSAFQTNITLNLKGNIKEKSKIIKSYTRSSNEDFHTDFYRENIITATFLDDITVPVEAIKTWDISENKKGGVTAYIKESKEENGKYDLYITAKNGVIANPNSSFLFYKFTGLKTINFNNNFDTKNVTHMENMFLMYDNTTQKIIENNLENINFTDSFSTENVINMSQMFTGCNKLQTLDVSKFNTKNVQNMESTFALLSSLKKLDLSNFDTSNVKTMKWLFFADNSLETLNININTSNVTKMDYMFHGCSSLTELNLCSFDTSKVTSMDNMFAKTNNLKNIYVGPNWNTNNVITNTDMFYLSNISSVTKEKCNLQN